MFYRVPGNRASLDYIDIPRLHLMLSAFLVVFAMGFQGCRAGSTSLGRSRIESAWFEYEKPKPPRLFKGPWGYNIPVPPVPIPKSPIADPFVASAKAGIAKAVVDAKKLGDDERNFAKKNLEAKEKERVVVNKALKDVIEEKRQRDLNNKPPPGLLDPDDHDDPCPKDASGDTFR